MTDRIEILIEELEDRIRHLETDVYNLRKELERVSGDVVYLEGAIR